MALMETASLGLGLLQAVMAQSEYDKARAQNVGLLQEIYGRTPGQFGRANPPLFDQLLESGQAGINRVADLNQRSFGTLNRQDALQFNTQQGLLAADQSRLGSLARDRAGTLQSTYERGAGELATFLSGRTKSIMDRIAGLGEQERKDINLQYDNFKSEIGQNVTATGLGATTIGSTLRSGNERNRRSELARLDERLRREQAGTEMALTGDEANALAARAAGRTSLQSALSGELLNREEGDAAANRALMDAYQTQQGGRLANYMNNLSSIESQRMGLNMGNIQDRINFLQSVEVGYPNVAQSLQSIYNAGFASKPYEPPKPSFNWFGLAGGGASGAALGGVAGALVPGLGVPAGLALGSVYGLGQGAAAGMR